MVDEIETLKRLDLVAFLSRIYGLVFTRQGATFACLSPFSEETRRSFFVRQVNGHWLFKDFSSGLGGSIFDFIQARENLSEFSEALSFLRRLQSGGNRVETREVTESGGEGIGKACRYDIEALYERFRQADVEVCREYLLGRKIAGDLVEELIREGIVVHNQYKGVSYCCFAVRDPDGRLRGLDNHEVEGGKKFVLGEKPPFSMEWDRLQEAKAVFIAEGIIDYLSVKTLEGRPLAGLALLGNSICFEASLLEAAQVLNAAVDDDRGGNRALLDLRELYPEKEIQIYDLQGHKDPNALLMAVGAGRSRGLSPERKLELYREFQGSKNRTELAAKWGIDRTYLYEMVRDCERILLESLSSRRPGRPAKNEPSNLEEARARLKELEAQYEAEATKREELYCRSEFLALRLKYAQLEAAEARGEKVEDGCAAQKGHVKKKRKRRRSIR